MLYILGNGLRTAKFRQSVEIRGKVGPNFEIILLVKSSLKLNLNMILANEIILKLGPTFSRIFAQEFDGLCTFPVRNAYDLQVV